jgi:RNA polymerase sigma factor (sigma-70 family)
VARDESVYAYAQRTLVNTYFATKRKRSSGEQPVADLPDLAHVADDHELRLVMLAALATLTPKTRAVIILRYWEDLPIDDVARITGSPVGTVKSESARGLARLRARLGDSLLELC